MGKRYGRNQKRKHREAISLLIEACLRREAETLEANSISHRTRAAYIGLELRVKDWDDQIRWLLGTYSAFLFQPGIMVTGNPNSIDLIPIMKAISAMAPYPSDMAMTSTEQAFARITRFTIAISDDDIMTLKRLIRLKISDGKGDIHYALSEDMVSAKLLGEPEIYDFAAEIARQMIDLANHRQTPKRKYL